MSLPIATQRFVKRTLLLLIAAYAGDCVWFRVRLIHPKPADPLESFTVPRILAIPENSGKTSYEIDQQNPEQTVTCVHSVFPHGGFAPCWYVRPRISRPIPM
jgi:hypothetical protein